MRLTSVGLLHLVFFILTYALCLLHAIKVLISKSKPADLDATSFKMLVQYTVKVLDSTCRYVATHTS